MFKVCPRGFTLTFNINNERTLVSESNFFGCVDMIF